MPVSGADAGGGDERERGDDLADSESGRLVRRIFEAMKDLTEIVCVWDRSGSMGSVKQDAIGGFNGFLSEQKKAAKPSRLTYVQFDHQYERVYELTPILFVPLLTEDTYVPRGMTALLDAIGRTIDEVGAALDRLGETEKPARVLVVIYTDGYENASRKYSQARVREMITHQRQKYSWEFIFLAANIDAEAVGSSYGIQSQNCVQTLNSGIGNQAIGAHLANAAAQYANSGSLRGMNLQQDYDQSVKEEEKKKPLQLGHS